MNRSKIEANRLAFAALIAALCLSASDAFAELDRTGVAVDTEVSDIDRLAAEGMFLQNPINAEIPVVGGYDENALNAFQRRVIRHEEPARKFKTDFPAYQEHQKDYNDAVAEFERDCSNRFTAEDLNAAKANLGIK